MKRFILALGMGAALLSMFGCQGSSPRIEPVQSRGVRETSYKPPVLHEMRGLARAAVGNPVLLYVSGEAGTSNLKEVVFQVWAAGRGSIETGFFTLPEGSRKQMSGRIKVNTLASVGFIQSRDFELLPLEFRLWLRDESGTLSPAKVHQFQFDERAYNAPPVTLPKERDYSPLIGTIFLEIFPLDFNERDLLRRRRHRF
ncbi:MAG: hypothetical protein ACE5JS_01630 [Nitrospinota bacterium]